MPNRHTASASTRPCLYFAAGTVSSCTGSVGYRYEDYLNEVSHAADNGNDEAPQVLRLSLRLGTQDLGRSKVTHAGRFNSKRMMQKSFS